MGRLGLEPRTYGLTYQHLVSQAALSLGFVGLDFLTTLGFNPLGPGRKVSTPSSFEAWLGIAATRCAAVFPEFDRIHFTSFLVNAPIEARCSTN